LSERTSWWAADAALRSESRRAIAWSSGKLVLADLLGSTRRADDLAGVGALVVSFTILILGTGIGVRCHYAMLSLYCIWLGETREEPWPKYARFGHNEAESVAKASG
jgi:hypothetical protein